MRVGLLADTHDRLPVIAEFVRRFGDAGIGLVLHAGDFCSPFALQPFRDASMPLAGVFGRNDGDPQGLRAEAAKVIGAELYESPHSVSVENTRLLLVHDLGEVSERSFAEHRIIVHGASHRHSVTEAGNSLLVNPGEACGWLYGTCSAAILDLETREVEWLFLDQGA